RFQCHQPIISRYITIVNTVMFHPSRSAPNHYMLELAEVVVRAKDTGCGRPLGIASGTVQDFQITASSIVDLITAMEIQGVVIQGWVENRDDIILKLFSVSYGVTEDTLVLYKDNNKTV
ncbi:uncharacterized protein LOC126828044, partial [Patella vulgata]|uniref:uncharacterized protein LOC126828044 n=1 Tax=Patella vulgata TaxID=6465 RepID=UPI0024A8C773